MEEKCLDQELVVVVAVFFFIGRSFCLLSAKKNGQFGSGRTWPVIKNGPIVSLCFLRLLNQSRDLSECPELPHWGLKQSPSQKKLGY